jgi:hypothetical protein
VTALQPAGGQALGGGYERVFGTGRGVVAGTERVRGLAYARVQWQTGLAAAVPPAVQGVGEVVVRDFARALRPATRGVRSSASARARSSSTRSWPRASTRCPEAAAPTSRR